MAVMAAPRATMSWSLRVIWSFIHDKIGRRSAAERPRSPVAQPNSHGAQRCAIIAEDSSIRSKLVKDKAHAGASIAELKAGQYLSVPFDR